MIWKTDPELFADIDEKGKLFDDEFTKMMLKGSAKDSIHMSRKISHNEYTMIQQKGFEDLQAFRDVVEEIRKYVKGHNHIGAFPSEILELKVEQTKNEAIYKDNPNYNAALDSALRNVDEIEDDVRDRINQVTDTLDYGRGGAMEVSNMADREKEKLRRAADDARERLRQEAEDGGYGTSTSKTVYAGSRKVVQSSKKNSYCFFDAFSSWWRGTTKITSLEEKQEVEHAGKMLLLFRALAWAGIIGCLLLMANMVWEFENPVSALLLKLLEPDMLHAVLLLAASALLLFLIVEDVDWCPIFDISIPLPAFAYPIILGTCFYASEAVETFGKLSEQLSKVTLLGTVLIFLYHIVVSSGYWRDFWDALKALGALFLYTGLCAIIVVKVCEHQKLMIGFLLAFGALSALSNLVSIFASRKSELNWDAEILEAVEEHALTEYKMLRFIRLWILNSGVSDKETYLNSVQQEENHLKEMVARAEEYAKTTKGSLRLK